MQFLAAELGDPQSGRLTIHVGGSKGKGSVSTMCANILSASGLKTGLYTSPHILRWKERISFADHEMPEETLISAMEEVLPLIEGKSPGSFPGGEMPTYFELTTLLAFCAFRASGCSAQVVEVGLGGRLDSTNIVVPDVSVITPIELEHTQFLGDTIGKIAFEKAGINKARKARMYRTPERRSHARLRSQGGRDGKPAFPAWAPTSTRARFGSIWKARAAFSPRKALRDRGSPRRWLPASRPQASKCAAR